MSARARSLDFTGNALPEKTDIARKRQEVQKAAQGVVVCLRTLTQSRLTRWLPLDSYVAHPPRPAPRPNEPDHSVQI